MQIAINIIFVNIMSKLINSYVIIYFQVLFKNKHGLLVTSMILPRTWIEILSAKFNSSNKIVRIRFIEFL